MRFPRGGREVLRLLDGGTGLHRRLLIPGEGTAGLSKIILEVFIKIFGNGVTSAQPARVGGSLTISEGGKGKKEGESPAEPQRGSEIPAAAPARALGTSLLCHTLCQPRSLNS